MGKTTLAKSEPKRILCVAGARPNFVKIGPLMGALRAEHRLSGCLVHTGQHYDPDLSDRFFADLGIPAPDVSLDVGSASHAAQTAEVMIRFEPVVDRHEPACVVVVGDVNSTIACALVAVKKGIPVAHVEAGLRSFDRTMPEEINRLLTDQISDLLFTTEPAARRNLLREGVDDERIHFVGNIMIDSLMSHLTKAVPAATTLAAAGVPESAMDHGPRYGVVTLHRPSNVDSPTILRGYLETLRDLAAACPLIFPLHPRTRRSIEAHGLGALLQSPYLFAVRPLGYLAFLGLIKESSVVITDSGGLQEETTALGVPCLTVRDNTERPITVEQGTNRLVGASPDALAVAFRSVIAQAERNQKPKRPDLWDGRTAERIVAILRGRYDEFSAAQSEAQMREAG